MKALVASGLREIVALVGREEALHTVHGAVLRAAQSLRPVVESGALLAACSDEFNGEVRSAFERDVTCFLSAPNVPSTRRVFSVSNLGGRIEPGAIALANLHFTARSAAQGQKLLLIEIASHVGRRETKAGAVWGELDRFGTPSPCCGALRLLLDTPKHAEGVRFPWFEQLTAFFGPARLAALRRDTSPYAMLRAAIVHAVLQAETAIVDLLREPPATPTHVLLVALVVVNRRGTDNAIPVGVHHLHFAEGAAELGLGESLRSTPDALDIDATRAFLQVSSPFEEVPESVGARPHVTPVPAALSAQARVETVRSIVERGKRQLALLRRHPDAARIYARPILRVLLQELATAAPEVGLAALALEGEREILRARGLEQRLAQASGSAEARAILHDFEPALQQLAQGEALALLENLLAEPHPLFCP